MTKAIIFGITGQDGSYLAELLLKKGYEVIGVTRRVSVNTLTRIEHILPQLTIVEGDITDGFNISKIIESHEPDEVYNLGAQIGNRSLADTPLKTFELGWRMGTLCLFRVAQKLFPKMVERGGGALQID